MDGVKEWFKNSEQQSISQSTKTRGKKPSKINPLNNMSKLLGKHLGKHSDKMNTALNIGMKTLEHTDDIKKAGNDIGKAANAFAQGDYLGALKKGVEVAKTVGKTVGELNGGQKGGNDPEVLIKLTEEITNNNDYFIVWLLITLFKDIFIGEYNINHKINNLIENLEYDSGLEFNSNNMIHILDKCKLRILDYIGNDTHKHLSQMIYDEQIKREDPQKSLDFLNESISSIISNVQMKLENSKDKVNEARERKDEILTKIGTDEETKYNTLENTHEIQTLVDFSQDSDMTYLAALLLIFIELRYNISKTEDLGLIYEIQKVNSKTFKNIVYEGGLSYSSIYENVKKTILETDRNLDSKSVNFLVENIMFGFDNRLLKNLDKVNGNNLKNPRYNLGFFFSLLNYIQY